MLTLSHLKSKELKYSSQQVLVSMFFESNSIKSLIGSHLVCHVLTLNSAE